MAPSNTAHPSSVSPREAALRNSLTDAPVLLPHPRRWQGSNSIAPSGNFPARIASAILCGAPAVIMASSSSTRSWRASNPSRTKSPVALLARRFHTGFLLIMLDISRTPLQLVALRGPLLRVLLRQHQHDARLRLPAGLRVALLVVQAPRCRVVGERLLLQLGILHPLDDVLARHVTSRRVRTAPRCEAPRECRRSQLPCSGSSRRCADAPGRPRLSPDCSPPPGTFCLNPCARS